MYPIMNPKATISPVMPNMKKNANAIIIPKNIENFISLLIFIFCTLLCYFYCTIAYSLLESGLQRPATVQ